MYVYIYILFKTNKNKNKSKSIKTNIGGIFTKLISKHFPPNHKFAKTFNRNTIKLSYSCMPNIRSKINGHIKKVLQSNPKEPQKLRNCLIFFFFFLFTLF